MTTSEQLGDATRRRDAGNSADGVRRSDTSRRSGPASQDRKPGTERRAARIPRAFPGGAVRLPRLSRPSDAPPEELSDEPLRRNPEERAPGKDRGFETYYSTESLFEAPPTGPAAGSDGPYGMLGLTRAASWDEVAKSHRRLVSQLHPDRYVDADDTVRAAAERRVRDVNEAYATIRRQRAVQRA